MAALDSTGKAGLYETLSRLNTAFSEVVKHLHTLQQTKLLRSKTARLFPGFAQELQAEFNEQFLETLHQIELEDWNEYGKARQRWEKYLRDPNDVLIQAEERKKQLAKQKQRKKK